MYLLYGTEHNVAGSTLFFFTKWYYLVAAAYSVGGNLPDIKKKDIVV
jgi:hypothetical protein